MEDTSSSAALEAQGEEVEEEVDPLALALEEAEDQAALRGGEAAAPAFTAVLENVRADDEALRVKELAVYK
jgi:NADPH-dependent ferric siderophore reductase